MNTLISQALQRAFATLLVFAGIFFFAFDAQAAPVTVNHSQGELTLKDVPKKIVVFDLATLDTLDILGVPVQGVPKLVWPETLKKYAGKDYTVVGSLFEPDYEAVNAMQPDLIIVAGRSAPKYADLAKIAPAIDLTLDNTKPLISAKEHIRTLGTIFGKGVQAEAKIKELEDSIASLSAKAATKGTGLIILTTGGKISAYGPGSRFGMLHDVYGVAPVDKGLSTANHGQPVSFEYILEKNPDWLFVIDRDAAIGQEGVSAAKLLKNDLMDKTTCVKKGQIVYLNAANWYLIGAGLHSLQTDVNDLLKAFSAK